MDEAIDNQKGLDELRRKAGWLMYYWDMFQEDWGFAKRGGPELEWEVERKRELVEVRVSNFGRSEGLDMSHDKLFREIMRVVFRVEEVKVNAKGKMKEGAAVKDFAKQGEVTGKESTDTSKVQNQPPHQGPSGDTSTAVKSALQATNEAGGSLDDPKLTKPSTTPTTTPTDNDKVSNAAPVPQIAQVKFEEQVDTEEPQFYEALEQCLDTRSQGSDDIPWAPMNVRAKLIHRVIDRRWQ